MHHFFKHCVLILVDQTAILSLVIGSVIIFAGSFLIMEVLVRVLSRAARRAGAHKSVVITLRELLFAIWIVVAISVVVSYTGLANLFTALTISGIAGLVISLALQSTFSNVISGALLLSDGTVHVGDIVQFSGLKGEVVRLSLRNTWIKTEQGAVAIIGNSNLASGPVVNISGSHRLLKKLE
jgi:small conductance mechanosensitive channel